MEYLFLSALVGGLAGALVFCIAIFFSPCDCNDPVVRIDALEKSFDRYREYQIEQANKILNLTNLLEEAEKNDDTYTSSRRNNSQTSRRVFMESKWKGAPSEYETRSTEHS